MMDVIDLVLLKKMDRFEQENHTGFDFEDE